MTVNPTREGRDEIFGENDRESQLRAQGLVLMLKGGGYAAAVVLAVLAFVLVFVFIGSLLPEASKQSPDPTPSSTALEVEGPVRA